MLVDCVIACHNAQGDPDLFFCRVECSEEQYARDDHISAAQSYAQQVGWSGPYVTFCPGDVPDWLFERFEWRTASIVRIAPTDAPAARQYDAAAVAALIAAIDRYRFARRALCDDKLGSVSSANLTAVVRALSDQIIAAYDDMIAAHAALGKIAPPPLADEDGAASP